MATEVKTKKGSKDYFEAVGRRKTSIARVRISPSPKNVFSINGKDMGIYFPTDELQSTVRSPFETDKSIGAFSVSAKVVGGGIHSQAEAVRHGISRALVKNSGENRSKLKKHGFLKRDPRTKERRKFGLKKARKAPQWSKR